MLGVMVVVVVVVRVVAVVVGGGGVCGVGWGVIVAVMGVWVGVDSGGSDGTNCGGWCVCLCGEGGGIVEVGWFWCWL